MKLLNLTLDHVKHISHFDFIPGGNNAAIFGDNATGKTTIADGYFWLLFGKDSTGRSDFDILPMDKDGEIMEGLEASVSGKFVDNDGKEFTLHRAYHQVFTRKNGEAERKFKGNTTEFFINDVPKPQKDYQSYVAGICDEQTFMLLTDPDRFPGKMGWSDRRDMLIKYYASDIDDCAIINAHKELQPLSGYIGFKSVDEYVEITKAQRKKINDQLKDIPGRIDEAEKAKPQDMPDSGDGLEMVRLSKQKMQLESNISKIRNGESVSALQKNIAEIQTQIAKGEAEYTRKSAAGNSGLDAQAAQLRPQISELEQAVNRAEKIEIPEMEGQVKRLSEKMDFLRSECKKTAALEFDPSNNICPTCGQEYPPERQQQIQDDFNEQKAENLKRMEADGKKFKKSKDSFEKGIQSDRAALQQDHQRLSVLQSQLEQTRKQYITPAPFSETDEYNALQEKLLASESELNVVVTATDKRVSELQAQLTGIAAQLDEIKKRALNKDTIVRQNERIAELKKQDKELSTLLATYDNGLLLAEKFTQQKAKDIEGKVNSAFQLVRWKLFDTQVNGGIKPCCEATVDGIPYGKDLNSAAKLNAGLDIINALSQVVGVSVPIWIDNAESVTRYLPVSAQVIRLHVSAGEKKLRVEVQQNG